MLHICTINNGDGRASDTRLSISSKAKATVDYGRRRKVAPNHTMTHVMNYALREVRWCVDLI